MSQRSETFGRLLKGAINSIATYEGKSAPAIEEELGAQIGVTGASVQRYKAGYLPPDPRPVQILAEAGVRRGFLARAWLVRFLQAARYPAPETLLAQLAEALGVPHAAPHGSLPVGTVALLLTDVVSHSASWEAQPRAMERAMERHDTILRQAIDAYGGQVWKTVGDAFYAVFTTAPAALEAALHAQRALHAEHWGPIEPLAVRMAIHVGAPQLRDDDYVGPALTRVTRMLRAGHGGQLLLSTSAQELSQDRLPANVMLVDLGEQRLTDLGRPERLFQASSPDLPSTFPPLRTLDAYRHNLPPQATPLVGREAEVRQICALFKGPETRLVTLTGPGGVGKTRLVLQAAADLLDRHPDGACFVSLAELREPAYVAATLAQALGLHERPNLPVLDQLTHALATRRLLLVLDNFEQVIAAAPLVGDLLAAAPGVAALVTSREPLRLYGEQEYSVQPLALPAPDRPLPLERLTQVEALRLFIARARAVRPDLPVNAETAPIIAEICARLDGLPLAIELAAARTKLFPPQALLARLDQRLKLLTGGPRDLPARQQTLSGAIGWSYDLLDAAEQTIFARLGVFAGGCTLEMAEAVIGDDGADDEGAAYVAAEAVLAGVSALVDRSLVRQVTETDGEVRLVLLETIREYAQERLETSGEAPIIRNRHARTVAALAEQVEPLLRGPEQAAALSRLEAEHSNIRAALAWSFGGGDPADGLRIASACARFWFHRNHFGEGLDWLERGLTTAAHAPVALRARALSALLWHAAAICQPSDTAAASLDEALASCREAGNQAGLALAQMVRALALAEEGAAKTTILEQGAAALTDARETGDAGLLAELLSTYAGLCYQLHALPECRRAVEEGLSLARQVGAPRLLALLLWRSAGVPGMDPGQREAWLAEAEGLAQEFGDPHLLGLVIQGHGVLAGDQDDWGAAAKHYRAALAILEAHGYRQLAGVAEGNLGEAAFARGELDACVRHYRRVLEIGQSVRSRYLVGWAALGLAQVAVRHGQAELGARLFGALSAQMGYGFVSTTDPTLSCCISEPSQTPAPRLATPCTMPPSRRAASLPGMIW